MIELLFKASLAIGIALLFYKLVLQQESFFGTNRLYLLGCIVLAFALPFITLPKLVSQQGYLSSVFQDQIFSETASATGTGEMPEVKHVETPILTQPGTDKPEDSRQPSKANDRQAGSAGTDLIFWLTMLYLSGVAIFTFSLLFQVGNLAYKIVTARDKIRDGNYVIVNTTGKQAPCSFFRFIFIYPDDYDLETYEQIIAHEKTHGKLGHSVDMLFTEVAVILLWFNPLIWLLKKEIEKNNEYQTDARMLEKEQVRRDQYQLNLLQIAVPNKPLSITTNYNQSLIKQRILMMNAKRSSPHAYWKYTFLAPLFFGMLLLLNEPAVSQNDTKTAAGELPGTAGPSEREERATYDAPEIPARKSLPLPGQNLPALTTPTTTQGENSINLSNQQTDMSSGYWYSSLEDGDYCIQFRGGKDASNWNMSECFDAGTFEEKENNVFVMTREAGTLQLTGNLDAEVGQGKYRFSENASFKKYLTDNGIASNDQNLMFHLFFGDVDRKYVDFLRRTYTTIEGDRLLELAIHGVSVERFKNYIALFKKYSDKEPSIEEVIEATIHGIDEDYVAEIQAMGFSNLSLKKMMEAKIHGVDAAYVESLKKAGFDHLTMDKIIEARIHDVKPATIREVQTLGFGDQSLNKIIELHIHDVNAAYIQELKSAELSNLTLDQIIEAKIHGINATYVEDLKKAGFGNLSMDELVEAKIHGINSSFIEEARRQGYNLSSIDEYIALKIHGTAMESLKKKGKEK